MESLPPLPPASVAAAGVAPSKPEPTKQPEGPSFRDVLEGLGQRIDEGERLVQQLGASPGGDDASRLIALQAGIYRYSEAIDLSAKVVDRASSAVKTTLQSQ